jgi:hypothetical protein
MRRVLYVVGALGVVAALTPSAMAATTVGETFTPTTPGTCSGIPAFEVVQTGRASGPSYAAPSAGVFTSWSFQAGAANTTLTLRVFHPTGTAHEYKVVADAGAMETVAASSGLRTFPAQISVQTGDLVGIHATTGTCASSTGNSADTYDYGPSGPTTPVGGMRPFVVGSGYIWDIAAKLEPDADRDGFGDETQDKCATNATTHDPCPVPKTKKCKKKKHKRAAEIAKKKCKKKRH